MTGWYYDKKELKSTPSAQDGIDYETEMRYRKEGARFIINTGAKMDLGYNTTATGVVYFHRFYMFHSFRQFPRYVTACCCLFLAGKVEETPKKCKDIIKTAKGLLSDQKFATFGDDPKEEVMTLERILLQTIKFDLQVEHPYSYLLKYAKCLKGDKAKLQKMVQMAWTFVNDSLCTTLALQWEPEIIAVALMYLAGKLSKFEVVDWNGRTARHLRWWDMFVEDVTINLLDDICHQVLDLYSQPTNEKEPESPPLPPRPPMTAQSVSRKSMNGGQDKMDLEQQMAAVMPPVPPTKVVPPPPDVTAAAAAAAAAYVYPAFPGGPPPPVPFSAPPYPAPMPAPGPPHMGAPPPGPPPPHLGAPPNVFPPYVTHPPPYPPMGPPGAFYGLPQPPGQPPHRPY